VIFIEAAGNTNVVQAFVATLCTNILTRKDLKVVIFHMEQVDKTQIEEHKNLHIGIAILTTIFFAMWAYECDPTDYTKSGWLALIAIATTFIMTIAYNVLRVIKLYKSF
jgi:hypothetical protein